MTKPFSWPRFDPGRMVHRISILHTIEISDISGVSTQRVPLYGPMWAAIEPVSGREQIQAGQTTTQTIVLIYIYFQPGIENKDIVETDKGSQYYIQSIVNPLELDEILELTCMGLNENK